jgi:hypothetical protein
MEEITRSPKPTVKLILCRLTIFLGYQLIKRPNSKYPRKKERLRKLRQSVRIFKRMANLGVEYPKSQIATNEK